MKLSAKKKETLDKVYRLYNDNAAKQTKESQAAYEKLQHLCKTYKVDFDAFLKSKQSTAQTAKNATSEDKQAAAKPVNVSRRSFIIDCLKQGVFDKQSIAEAVALNLSKYSDLKKNLQAVSGTIYDLRRNYDADLTVCEETGRCLLKSYKTRR